jgi:hypothetical protein
VHPETASRRRRWHPAARPPYRWRHVAALGLLGLVIWLASAPLLHAQPIYEWREPDGTLTYGQKPPASTPAGMVRELHLPAEPPSRRAAALRVQAAAQPAVSSDVRSLRRADARIALALTSLDKAENALRDGQQPRPGERRHLVNGHSRLTRAYFDRIASLEAAVTKAREALQAAYTERDSLATR